jgi:hypothetical protein
MSLLVTMHVYSQRANPSWFLSSAQESRFNELFRGLREQTPLKARGGLPIFGYRGFAVSQIPGSEPSFFVSRGIVDPGSHQASLLDENRSVEAFLLESSGIGLDMDLKGEVDVVLQAPVKKLIELRLGQAAGMPSGCPNANTAADAPSYDPARWNAISAVVGNNNCYNYATNKPLNNYATPGKAGGINITYTSCDGDGPEGPVKGPAEGAVADGLKRTGNFPAKLDKGEGWYVAALLSEKSDDCHWLRQDFSGCWSHKNGEDEVRNVDADGRLITDPRLGNFGKYSIFCRFMIANIKVNIA